MRGQKPEQTLDTEKRQGEGVLADDAISFIHSYMEVRNPFYSPQERQTAQHLADAVEHHLRELQKDLHS